jgi:hydrogenase maturation protein HypF
VQGVGFRPFVYRHAVALGLVGFVRNDSEGVLIEVEGPADHIDALTRVLVDGAPPLARVATVDVEPIAAVGADRAFRIVASDGGAASRTPVSIDTAVCADCLAEVDDPADRRYRYPFTNCTNCGPRYTIVLSVPYDRPATTMAQFTMCGACQREYDDPTHRRFHAQPNACPDCGPHLQWRTGAGDVVAERDSALDAAVQALLDGQIVAVKGIGGYHLAVRADDDAAVVELRRRKARDDKPFAVMVADLSAAHALCELDARAEAALVSSGRPIVLVPRREGAAIAAGVAPKLPEIGLLLAYSPLHHLLLRAVGVPLVMTSGNVSDEPIAHDDDDAVARLGPMVDGLLTHDRQIHIRCDDSVARAANGRLQLLRRSRGFAPEPLSLPDVARRAVLALGAELKSTIAVARDGFVVASHHIGDLEHLATYRSFVQALDHLRHLYDLTPEVVAHDLHPEYLSTKLALELDLPTVGVQHHHAHIASCMVEHGRTDAVLGLAFDGLGYGPDGTMWGGEYLLADLQGFTRVAHLRSVPMPGGVAAIREPWRMAIAWGAPSGARPDVDEASHRAVAELAASGRGPNTTSVGRLFDALASLIIGRARVSYEAQAAIELEALARTIDRAQAPTYLGTVVAKGDVLDPTGLVTAVVDELRHGTPPAIVAAGVHEALGRGAAALAIDLAGEHGIDTVALSGGVFQNARLSAIVESELRAAGLIVLVHERVPPNDGGISIGQAAVGAFA